MKTKIVYVLASSMEDYFLEQCFISILSTRSFNPTTEIILVCDSETKDSLHQEVRKELLALISNVLVVDFNPDIDNVERSRKMKTHLRELVQGDFLYIDCDTLITSDLSEIDNCQYSIAAVLDGHQLLKSHPMRSYFANQNDHLEYDFSIVEKYFSGGVIYAKDNETASNFYKTWASNYLISLQNGRKLDEPPLSMTNMQLGEPIGELDGVWNCQIRFGALYLSSAKILHFCSKKNMPVNKLATKEFLLKMKKGDISVSELNVYISDWRRSMPENLVLCTGMDAQFNLSREYEQSRRIYIQDILKNSIYVPKISELKYLYRVVRNKFIGTLSPRYLARVLYRETFGNNIDTNDSINGVIYKLAYQSNIDEWSKLADKIEVREYVKKKGFSEILVPIYKQWSNANDIDFNSLPNTFVLKCNHDNGSSIVIHDKFSVDMAFIKKFYTSKLKRTFGINTAEPHYRNIVPCVFAEEYLVNDNPVSDVVISYKFFSSFGNATYCQVVYDSGLFNRQRSIIYNVEQWKRCQGYIVKREGHVNIPRPKTLNKMLSVVEGLSADLPFCRVDLYELGERVYFSEITLMPSCGRIANFSRNFQTILGQSVKDVTNATRS